MAVAREGGLSGAARVLDVNHATVSRQLAKAEEAAGVRFFTRLASGLQATEAGEVAIAHAEEIEAQMVALDMALAARDETEEGELRVTIPPLLFEDHFAEDVKEFKELHPAIDLQILGATEMLNLHRREADVAIRVTQSPEESLWGRMATPQRAGWFAAPEFVDRYRDALEGRDPQTPLPYIAYLAWSTAPPKGLFADIANGTVAVRTDDMISAMALARRGVGMVRTSHFLGMGDPSLVPVPTIPLTDHVPIWVLTHPDLRHVPRVTEFMRFIAARFTARRDLYMGSDSAASEAGTRLGGARLEGTKSDAVE